jgi:butyrate kinase
MVNGKDCVLAIDPGTTSTKIGVFTRSGEQMTRTLRHGSQDLDRFHGQPALAQLEYRAGLIETALKEAGYSREGNCYAAVAGRGGLLPPLECGAYLVDEQMIEVLREAARGEHASNLGAPLALRFAAMADVKAYIVDPVTVDEWQPRARLTGSPLIERVAVTHALNTKAMARRYAREHGRAYADLRLIVVHMGSGITISAHQHGRMIDSTTIDEGPFGPDRTGSLPSRALAALCYSGRFSAAEMDRQIFGEGGLFAYLGTRDLLEVEQRIEGGDQQAARVLDAMVYQIAKHTGAMTAVLQGKVDAVVLTGGMAHSARVLNMLRPQIDWIAPVTVYPGEDELRALAEGVLRVLDGEEEAKRLGAN